MKGYIASFEITPTSTDDREGLRALANQWANVTNLADKDYVGKNRTRCFNLPITFKCQDVYKTHKELFFWYLF